MVKAAALLAFLLVGVALVAQTVEGQKGYRRDFAATGQPELPDIVNSFSVIVEATIGQMNRTLPIREMVDSDNLKGRFEIWSANSTEVRIEDWVEAKVYKIVNSDSCEVLPLYNNTFMPFGFRSSDDLFLFGRKFDPQYKGLEWVRGIPCDWWQAEAYFQTNYTLQGATTYFDHNLTLAFYFSQSWWNFFTLNSTSNRPVQMKMNGTRTNLSTGSPHAIDHVYTYANFVPRAPEAGLFIPPNNCLGIVSRAVAVVQQEPLLAGATLIAGIAIGIMLASIMACVIVRYKNRNGNLAQAAVGRPAEARGSEFNLKHDEEEDLRL